MFTHIYAYSHIFVYLLSESQWLNIYQNYILIRFSHLTHMNFLIKLTCDNISGDYTSDFSEMVAIC